MLAISCKIASLASLLSHASTSISISAAFRHRARQAVALVVSNRGIFCVGTKKKFKVEFSTTKKIYPKAGPHSVAWAYTWLASSSASSRCEAQQVWEKPTLLPIRSSSALAGRIELCSWFAGDALLFFLCVVCSGRKMDRLGLRLRTKLRSKDLRVGRCKI